MANEPLISLPQPVHFICVTAIESPQRGHPAGKFSCLDVSLIIPRNSILFAILLEIFNVSIKTYNFFEKRCKNLTAENAETAEKAGRGREEWV